MLSVTVIKSTFLPNFHNISDWCNWLHNRQSSNISRIFVRNKSVDHSDVVGASRCSNYIFIILQHLASMDWTKTTARRDEKQLSFGIWCVWYSAMVLCKITSDYWVIVDISRVCIIRTLCYSGLNANRNDRSKSNHTSSSICLRFQHIWWLLFTSWYKTVWSAIVNDHIYIFSYPWTADVQIRWRLT